MNAMRTGFVLVILALGLGGFSVAGARTITIGEQGDYPTLTEAATVALPQDTLRFLQGDHPGGQWVENLHGEPGRPIVITGGEYGQVRILGGTEGIHLSRVSHIRIDYLMLEGQTGNGINIDDGGVFDVPSHNVSLNFCQFRDMDATGNNDLLKLSGLDTFMIWGSTFERGAAGGSGIDMVGCHMGLIEQNLFQDLGSNAIQAKGGTRGVRILRNKFVDCGERSINLGGSTGLAFFRPQDAPYEAADILVRSNLFIGSRAPIAYVGSVRVLVENNTIWRPGRWAVRILQETVDTARFLAAGESVFANNIVVVDQNLARLVNVGPNTRPETFVFTNNLFFSLDDPAPAWDQLPGLVFDNLWDMNPQLTDTTYFRLSHTSPAIGSGREHSEEAFDFFGDEFHVPPAIGALELGSPTAVPGPGEGPQIVGLSLRSGRITWQWDGEQVAGYELFTLDGRRIAEGEVSAGVSSVGIGSLQVGRGIVLVRLRSRSGKGVVRVIATGAGE